MADTLQAYFRATINDSMNVQGTVAAYALVDPSATITTLLASLTSWLQKVDACIDGQLLDCSIAFLPSLPTTVKTAVATGAKTEQTGVINFYASGDTRRWGEALPSLSSSGTVISGGKPVVGGSSPIQELINLLLAGGTSLQYTNSNGLVLTSFADAYLSFRKRNKQLERSSYTTG